VSEVEQYAQWVLAPENAHKNGRPIKLAAQRFLKDLEREDLVFDEVEAMSMVNFCEKNCCLWEGDWQGLPMKFEPWMKFVFGQVFGWTWKATGKRRVTKFYLQISKKNAKSSLLGMLIEFHLFKDKIKTPQVFVGANNAQQAKICVNMVGKIIEASPKLNQFILDERVSIYKYEGEIDNIVHRERNGKVVTMSKEGGDLKSKTSGGKQGINASLGVVDEWGLAHDSNLMAAIETSQASRKERLMALATTAGFNVEGPCYSGTRKAALEILEGVTEDDSFLPFIYEIDKPLNEEGKPTEITVQYLLDHPEVWQQSNPSIDVIVESSYLKSQLEQAKNGLQPAVHVLTLNFNCWMNSPEVWIPKEVWDENTHGIKVSELDRVPECYAGLEIIGGADLNALVLFFPNVKPNVHGLIPIFWMPSGKVQKEFNVMKYDFSEWVSQGYILTTPGNAIENSLIYAEIEKELSKYRVNSGAFISTLAKSDILQNLILSGQRWEPISKGYGGQSVPTKEWEALFMQRRIEHFNNPVLAWMNSNCTALRKATELIVQRGDNGRTAGIQAGINAVAQWLTMKAEATNDQLIENW
jgi:phage terminase large subunit-like protein